MDYNYIALFWCAITMIRLNVMCAVGLHGIYLEHTLLRADVRKKCGDTKPLKKNKLYCKLLKYAKTRGT